MRFYTEQDCEDWLKERERTKPDAVPGTFVEQLSYPPTPGRILYYAHWIATALTFRMPTLLWITECGIWPSSENWHLHYKLRQTYNDHKLLHEVSGHLFLEHESEDLTSFLQLALLHHSTRIQTVR